MTCCEEYFRDLETIHCQHSRTDRIGDRDIHQKGYKATQPLMAGCFMDVLNKAAVASYDCPHSTTYMAKFTQDQSYRCMSGAHCNRAAMLTLTSSSTYTYMQQLF